MFFPRFTNRRTFLYHDLFCGSAIVQQKMTLISFDKFGKEREKKVCDP